MLAIDRFDTRFDKLGPETAKARGEGRGYWNNSRKPDNRRNRSGSWAVDRERDGLPDVNNNRHSSTMSDPRLGLYPPNCDNFRVRRDTTIARYSAGGGATTVMP